MILTLISQRIYNPQIIEPIRSFTGWQYVERIIPILIILGIIISVVVSVILIIVGGIKWITSGGNRDAIASARITVTNGVIGLVILLSMYATIEFINCVFKVNIGNLGCIASSGYVPPGPSPTSTPTPPGDLGTCACDLGIPLIDNCIPPSGPVCYGQLVCICEIP